MNPSRTHLSVNDRFKSRGLDIVETPEILGPNWQTVLHFWKYVESLSKARAKTIGEIYRSITFPTSYNGLLEDLMEEIMEGDFDSLIWAGIEILGDYENMVFFNYNCAVRRATYELICMHKVLERGQKLVFIPIFDNI